MALDLLWYRDAPSSWAPSWHIRGLWQQHGVNFLFGSPKSHKSTLRRYLLSCSLSGVAPFGIDAFRVEHPVQRALLILREDHPGAERARMDAVLAEFEHHATPEVAFARPFAFDLLQASHVGSLRKTLEQHDFDLVIFDPLVGFHSADENNASEMSQVGNALHALAEVATVVCIHHTAKSVNDPETRSARTVGERARGSSAIPGFADVSLHLTRRLGTPLHTLEFECKNMEEPGPLDLTLDPQTWLWQPPIALTPESVMAAILTAPGSSFNQIVKTLGRRRDEIRRLLAVLEEAGSIRVEAGPRNSHLHYPVSA